MRSIIGKTFVSMAVAASFFTAGCASNDELARVRADLNTARMVADQAVAAAQAAQSRADAANAAAQAAQSRADAANAAAQAAQAAADRAQAAAQNANAAIERDLAERTRRPAPRGARGERG